MKFAASIAFTLVLCAMLGFAQSSDSISFLQDEYTKIRFAESKENKKIGLSHITSDIITLEQFLSCEELTIEGIPELDIISYDLICFLPDNGGIRIHSGIGNIIPDQLIQDIIADGVSKILIENITALDHSENISLGFRYFNLK